jgi:hypothetical protein
MRTVVVLVSLLTAPAAQQAHFAPGRIEREKALLLGTAGVVLPEDEALDLVADLDADGDVDLLAATRVYANDGFGVFRRWHALDVAIEPVRHGFFAADGDAFPDLLTREHLYLGDGAGGFVDASAGLPPGFVADVVVLADLDGDGDTDVLSAATGSAVVRLSRNDGSGVFADAGTVIPPKPSGLARMAAGDVDGDGDLDVVLARDGVEELWLGDGAGGFAVAGGAFPAVADSTPAVVLADVDGDLDLDVVLGGHNGADRLLLNDGSGVFSAGVLPAAGPRTTPAILAFDRDGDGDVDLALLHQSQWFFWGSALAQPRLLVNDGAGGFSESSDLDALPSATGGRAADVDGDDDLDLLIFDASSSHRLYLDDGQGAFVPARSSSLAPPGPLDTSARVVAVGDLDGDGRLDAFTPQAIILQPQFGVYTRFATTLPALPYHCLDFRETPQANDVALGDVDGDGDLDALLACLTGGDCSGQLNRLWTNDGSGAFTDETAARLPVDFPDWLGSSRQVELVELDGDGDLDAINVRGEDSDGSGFSWSYLNDGSGVFTRQTELGLRTLAGAVGDLDGDGDVDYLEGGYVIGSNRIYENDGAAHFTEAPAALPASSGYGARAAAVGDIDADGDLDAYVSAQLYASSDTRSFVYVNDGTGTFTDEPERLPTALHTSSPLVFADLDADGRPELIASDRVMLNDGEGFFTEADATRTHSWSFGTRYVAADLDLDGDDDLVSVDAHQTTFASSFARHLEALGPVRLGKRMTLVVHGPTRTPYTLLASLGTVQTSLGTMGWLLVDPNQIVFATSGFLDGRGEALVRRSIPADPALLGFETFWQAFVGTPSHSTNLVVAEVTGS